MPEPIPPVVIQQARIRNAKGTPDFEAGGCLAQVHVRTGSFQKFRKDPLRLCLRRLDGCGLERLQIGVRRFFQAPRVQALYELQAFH